MTKLLKNTREIFLAIFALAVIVVVFALPALIIHALDGLREGRAKDGDRRREDETAEAECVSAAFRRSRGGTAGSLRPFKGSSEPAREIVVRPV